MSKLLDQIEAEGNTPAEFLACLKKDLETLRAMEVRGRVSVVVVADDGRRIMVSDVEAAIAELEEHLAKERANGN